MKRLSRIIGVATLAVMATGPAVAARNQPYHTLSIQEDVLALENGQVFGTPEELECPPGTMWLFFSNGSGQMPRLGHFDMALEHCSTFDPPFGESVGTTTFTAANGDMLVLEHDLSWVSIFNDAGDFDGFEGAGDWTVVDGSGRFATATGDGTIAALGDVPSDDTPMYDLPPGATLWTFEGEVEYRASDRSGR